MPNNPQDAPGNRLFPWEQADAPPPPRWPQPMHENHVHITMGSQQQGLGVGMHVLHGVMTLCTAGLWAPVWILHAIAAKKRVIR